MSIACYDAGEANAKNPVSQADYYRCLFPAAILAWRDWFGNPELPFGFVQIAGFNYGGFHSAADVRQAQLSALSLNHTFMSTAIDTGSSHT